MDEGEGVKHESNPEGSELPRGERTDGGTSASRGATGSGDELGLPDTSPRGSELPATPSGLLKLQPTYHAQLQEALIYEKDPAKYKLLAELLELEARRESEGWSSQARINVEKYKDNIASAKSDLYWSSCLNLIKWGAPALLAYAFAKWMIHFYEVPNREAAATCKEILLLLIGGTLGWIAKDRKDG